MQAQFETQASNNLANKDGELTFDSPWHAKTFAMAVKLHETGLFTWTEWADELSKHIKAFETHSKIESNDDYYKLWQTTLESLVQKHVQ